MKTQLEHDIKALANPERREVLMRFFKTGKGQYGEGDRFHSDCTLLYEMASPARSLWENRIAIVTTMLFIRHGDFSHTLAIADRLMTHPHDLIHKAVGWMLREVGKRDRNLLESYLKPRLATMPRTMLRYAIERFPEPLRKSYLTGRDTER